MIPLLVGSARWYISQMSTHRYLHCAHHYHGSFCCHFYQFIMTFTLHILFVFQSFHDEKTETFALWTTSLSFKIHGFASRKLIFVMKLMTFLKRLFLWSASLRPQYALGKFQAHSWRNEEKRRGRWSFLSSLLNISDPITKTSYHINCFHTGMVHKHLFFFKILLWCPCWQLLFSSSQNIYRMYNEISSTDHQIFLPHTLLLFNFFCFFLVLLFLQY